MESTRFDAAVKAAAKTAASRRAVLGLALGGALTARWGTADAACKKRCSRCKRCKHGRCRPQRDGKSCGSCKACQNGKCRSAPDGTACGADQACLFGICRLAGTCADPHDYCAPTFTPCGPVENDCDCFTTVGGSSICAVIAATCNNCTSDADCLPGEACASVPCGCTTGNGNGCVAACPAKPMRK